MAQKARKDRAKSNAATLKTLHTTSLIINLTFLLLSLTFFRSRSLWLWLVLSLPAFFCQFALERTGRPVFDGATGAVKSSGEDLAAPGLTEYMFDVVWVTWGVDALVLFFGNWMWWLWAVVPAYGAYKGYGMLGAARAMAGMAAGGGAVGLGEGAGAGAGNRKQRRAAA